MFGLFRQLDLFDIPWLCDNHAVLMSNANALQCCNGTKELLLLYPTQVVTADRPSTHLSAADDSEKKTKLHSRMNDRHQFPARPDPPSLAIFRDLALELYISDHESVLGDVCCCFPSFSSPNSVPRVIMPFPLVPVRRWDEFCSKIRRVFWCGLQGSVRPHLSVSLLG